MRARTRGARAGGFELPRDLNEVRLKAGADSIRLTNLQKIFWPGEGFTKRDLLQYYLDVSPWLLPHIQDRAMVMKRYPNGINGDFFFMKRAPEPRPKSIPICSIEHGSGNVIGFPVIENLNSLLWVVNLGCIDLNPWYAR
jgi:bifunctional non-homologous end joining protein LigD